MLVRAKMAKWLAILLLPLALAGCVVDQNSPLPMALGSTDTGSTDAGWATCLTYGDAPTFGNCKGPAPVSAPQGTN
jgi:hypothetical protein